MADRPRVIDTSTLSEVIKNRNQEAQLQARAYLSVHERFTFSIITRYEVLRGLHAKGAARQIRSFEKLCLQSAVLPLEDAIVRKAAEIYGTLKTSGILIDDADILIGATALAHGLGVVTENIRHFRRIPDLEVESWRSA